MNFKNAIQCRLSQCNRPISALLCAAVAAVMLAVGRDARAVTPESPEVKKVVASALSYLEKPTDNGYANQLGGRCLIGLVFVKSGRADHPRVKEAVNACREVIQLNPPEPMLDMYSNGLAIIFLCELSPQTYSREIEWFLGRMRDRQKPHGGWGYFDRPTGDTSQTQYAALSYWEAHRRGFNIEGGSVEKLADWLMRTQGPDGCWGYQGEISDIGKPVQQTETNGSMLAAGLGSLYICSDLLNIGPRIQSDEATPSSDASLPSALRPVKGEESSAIKKLVATHTNTGQVTNTIKQAHAWMSEHYQVDIGPKVFYYLYGLERYKSFQEMFDGAPELGAKWYNDGFAFLKEKQDPDGSWTGYCGAPCDTAFAVLFLLRSTQKSIRAKLGEGTLLAGRGLPTNLSRAKMRNGQLIVEQVHTKVDELLSMVDDDDGAKLDELARDPSQLVIDEVDENSARRLQQLVRGGEPEVRLLAVRALGRTGNLDYVPSLLYALTDPDRRIVLEARDNLQFISRNFDGYGPPDDFTEQQRFDALEAWKKWYLSLRPSAVIKL